MVPRSDVDALPRTDPAAESRLSPLELQKRKAPNGEPAQASRLAYVRSFLQDQGISERASTLILSS